VGRARECNPGNGVEELETSRQRPFLPYGLTMAVGWAQDGAVQDQIDATVDSAVKRARSRLAQGESRLDCEECGEGIPEARRQALPGVRRCVPCQSEADRLDAHQSPYNRRGSKDSQLK
jgi:phage/conjugal plasmid C-4 type zinc finger TraR family protein